MTSRERVLNTLEFKNADRIPLDIWVLPAARMKYGEELEKLQNKYEVDIASFTGPFDHGYTPAYYEVGTFTDPWGSAWSNIQAGIIGEVKKPVFACYDTLNGYLSPKNAFLNEWATTRSKVAADIAKARADGKFIIGGWVSLFERLQYLRGTEDLYCDIALEEPEMFTMIDIVMDFMRDYVDAWLEMDIDAMAFGDDWGTQISLLISPETWKTIFKPLYSELIAKMKAAGKKVFFHSDGYIFELYSDLIEIGVDAVNSQLWCMGVEKVAEKYAGQITFWGEISRQDILPNGSVQDVENAAQMMMKKLWINGGGLIGQSEINKDVPLENIDAFYRAWK